MPLLRHCSRALFVWSGLFHGKHANKLNIIHRSIVSGNNTSAILQYGHHDLSLSRSLFHHNTLSHVQVYVAGRFLFIWCYRRAPLFAQFNTPHDLGLVLLSGLYDSQQKYLLFFQLR